MCARKAIITDFDKLKKIFGVTHGPTPNFRPRYNFPITERAPIVRQDDGGRRILELATWDYGNARLKKRPVFFNARGEDFKSRAVFAERRCLLPCDGFYEWLSVEQPGRRTPKKIPFFFCREDRQPFAMGGVWTMAPGESSAPEMTYVELTTLPSPLVEPIHARMSLIIDLEDWAAYLNGTSVQAGELVRPNPMAGFIRYAVRPLNVKDEGPHLIEPADPEPEFTLS